VAAHELFTDREQEFLRILLDEGVEFMIVGLAAAALQGVPAVTQGIDLWFADRDDPALRRALRKAGVTYVPPTEQNPPLLVGARANLFDIVVHMHGLGSFADEVSGARIIAVGGTELRVLPLERVIASKEATGRPKDLAILPVLRDALRVIEEDA
jgi:hypothetical protein